MTVKDLLWFRCRVCKTDFLSYVEGRDMFYCHEDSDGQCFYDNKLGEIHNNHVLNPIKQVRKCRKCRKANQLEEFI
jgi:hypothetical protein